MNNNNVDYIFEEMQHLNNRLHEINYAVRLLSDIKEKTNTEEASLFSYKIHMLKDKIQELREEVNTNSENMHVFLAKLKSIQEEALLREEEAKSLIASKNGINPKF